MLRQYYGRLGQGKTTMMLYDAWPFLIQPDKYNIVTNQPILINYKGKRFEYPPVEREELIEKILNSFNTLFLIDEIHLVFPSDQMKLDGDLKARLSYLRKYGNALLYTSQGYNHVHKRIRDLTNEICKVKRTKLNPFWGHVGVYYDPEMFDASIRAKEDDLEKMVLYRRYAWRWTIKKIYKSFETTYTTTSTNMKGEFKQPRELGVKLGLYNHI